MFVLNIDDIKDIETYKCNGMAYKYLVKKFPVLSFDGEYYYFSKTKELINYISKMPFYMKFF